MKMSFVFSHPSHKMATARQLGFTMQKGNTQAPKLWVREDNSAGFWEIEEKKPQEALIQTKK